MSADASRRGPDPDATVAALLTILDDHPDAAIAALRPDGRFCPMPEVVPVDGHRILEGRAGLDLLAPQSRAAALDQVRRLPAHGAGEIEVVTVDGRPARHLLFDTRERFGITVLVLIEGEPDDDRHVELGVEDLAPVRPRYGRARRTEVGELIAVDESTLAMMRYEPDAYAALDVADTMHPDDYPGVVSHWFDLLVLPPGTARRARVRYCCGDGSWLWVELTITNRLDGTEPHMLTEMVDISDEMAAIQQVWESQELLLRLTEALPLGVLQIDAEHRIVHANERLPGIVGIAAAETLDEQFAGLVEADRDELMSGVERVLDVGVPVDIEVRFHGRRALSVRYGQVAIRPLFERSGGVTGAVLCVSDVTEATRLRQELEVRAAFDPLTQCYNRATVMAELDRRLDRGEGGTALVFIDLDGFKAINDRWGHAHGDEVLTAAAAALGGAVRAQDVVGRIGGDEFVVVCPEVVDAAGTVEIGERIAAAMAFDVVLDGQNVPVRASIGVAWTDQGGAGAEALVAAADAAMYDSKRRGDHRPVVADIG